LFTPLMPQVASSYIEPRHIIQAIREIRGKRRFRFIRGKVQHIDVADRVVHTSDARIPYDYLVVALGSKTGYFGVPGAEEHTFPFKTLEDAIVLRRHVIDLFEHADREPDPGLKRQLLTFVVVGGGYTGVELVAELNDFIRKYAAKKYQGIFYNDTKLLLLESDPEILKGVDPDLAARAMKKLRSDNIEVRTSARVSRCYPEGVEINGEVLIKAGLVVWAAGVMANPVLESTPFPKDRLGRLKVNTHLQVQGYPEVYAVGDNAHLEGAPAAKASRPVIPIALHQGRRAAENIVASIRGEEMKPAEYKPRGYLVSLGMNDAVLKVWRFKMHGFFAWLLWNAYHVFKLVGLKKQLQVAADWSLATVFPRDGSIIIPSDRCERCRRAAGKREAEVLPVE
ncbi:MAG: NAD(P)/FAD-dependent oxidoreductase, partial [Dehalococcoidia bacterium]